jgi:murein L,D-transpeptidase YafK
MFFKILFTGIALLTSVHFLFRTPLPDSPKAAHIRDSIWPVLNKQLHLQKFPAPARIYMRIFKEESMMELWVQDQKQFRLFRQFPICAYTGGLGTKTRDRDGKSPEGFYTITPKQLNPVSHYQLAINIGYPNDLEKLRGYTGNSIMIHGSCRSIGCYAMTDLEINEIYTLVYKAFEGGQQKIELAIFPFRMDSLHMKAFKADPNMPFWKSLKPGYDLFQQAHLPPAIWVKKKNYAFAMAK